MSLPKPDNFEEQFQEKYLDLMRAMYRDLDEETPEWRNTPFTNEQIVSLVASTSVMLKICIEESNNRTDHSLKEIKDQLKFSWL